MYLYMPIYTYIMRVYEVNIYCLSLCSLGGVYFMVTVLGVVGRYCGVTFTDR
jgi:hypothetical protein